VNLWRIARYSAMNFPTRQPSVHREKYSLRAAEVLLKAVRPELQGWLGCFYQWCPSVFGENLRRQSLLALNDCKRPFLEHSPPR